jgi:hypothetical protein
MKGGKKKIFFIFFELKTSSFVQACGKSKIKFLTWFHFQKRGCIEPKKADTIIGL